MSGDYQVVHYSPVSGARSNTYACLSEKVIGTKSSPILKQVTCVACLHEVMGLNDDSKTDKKFKDIKHCDDCIHLNLTEEAQNRAFFTTGIKAPHRCEKFGVQLFHENAKSARILRYAPCIECCGYTTVGMRYASVTETRTAFIKMDFNKLEQRTSNLLIQSQAAEEEAEQRMLNSSEEHF